MDKTTTDLDKVKLGEKFTWGKVVKIHSIGEYDFVEYHPHKYDKGGHCTYLIDHDLSHFHIYIDGKSTSEYALSLDEALVLAISHKYEGPNHRAGVYFIKMIKRGEN